MKLARTVARPTTFRLAALLIEIDDQRYRVERLTKIYLGFTKIDGTEWPPSYQVCPRLNQCSCRSQTRNRICKHLHAVRGLAIEELLTSKEPAHEGIKQR